MFRNAAKLLIVAPHADDEFLGLGGTLLRFPDREAYFVLACCSDTYMHSVSETVTGSTRQSEWDASVFALGGVGSFSFGFQTGRIGDQNLRDLIHRLDEVILEVQPDVLFLPAPSLHQDHQQVHRAGLTAARATAKHRVPTVILYEAATSGLDQGLEPNCWCDISSTVEAKSRLFEEIYPSQLTGRRTRDRITAHAKYRGFEAGVQAAEAFQIVRTSA